MESVKLEVGEDVLKPIIESKINTAVLEALKGSEDLVAALVSKILVQPVDGRGNPCREDSYNKEGSLIDHLCKEAITNAAKEAIGEWIKDNTPKIKEQIIKGLKKSPSKVANALVDGLSDGLKTDCSWRINVKFETPRE